MHKNPYKYNLKGETHWLSLVCQCNSLWCFQWHGGVLIGWPCFHFLLHSNYTGLFMCCTIWTTYLSLIQWVIIATSLFLQLAPRQLVSLIVGLIVIAFTSIPMYVCVLNIVLKIYVLFQKFWFFEACHLFEALVFI